MNSQMITKETPGVLPIEGDITGKTVILRADVLVSQFQEPENQFVLATGGFGCYESTSGKAVFTKYVKDGEESRHSRNDFIGIASPELVEKYFPSETKPAVRVRQIEWVGDTNDGDALFGEIAGTKLTAQIVKRNNGNYTVHVGIGATAIHSYYNNPGITSFDQAKQLCAEKLAEFIHSFIEK